MSSGKIYSLNRSSRRRVHRDKFRVLIRTGKLPRKRHRFARATVFGSFSDDPSSTFMDSADKGAGWGADDGPISNMSAKGVTGNQLPNNMEIGGRSGEGRNGKSDGQMVGNTAVGKGGNETPTRMTATPFENGSVNDTSKDTRGGATGGGKLAGFGQEGLRGTPPPPPRMAALWPTSRPSCGSRPSRSRCKCARNASQRAIWSPRSMR